MINTCVPMNFVKSELIDDTENSKQFTDKQKSAYPSSSGKT